MDLLLMLVLVTRSSKMIFSRTDDIENRSVLPKSQRNYWFVNEEPNLSKNHGGLKSTALVPSLTQGRQNG